MVKIDCALLFKCTSSVCQYIDIAEAISMADKVVVLSNRPASIKTIHNIQLTCDGAKTPIKCREAPEFRHYFNKIWKELDVHVK